MLRKPRYVKFLKNYTPLHDANSVESVKRLCLALPLGTDRTLRSPEKCCSSRGGRFPLQLRPGGDSAFTVGGKNALSRETRDTFAWPRMAHAVPSCQEGSAFTAEMLHFFT